MFERELTLFLFVVVVYALVSVKCCTTHPRCVDGDHAISLNGKCLCKRDVGYCSSTADCGYEHCGTGYAQYCHTGTHKCGCIKVADNSPGCTTDSNCNGIHCAHSYYEHICHTSKCYCMKHVAPPACTHEHHHHHHDAVHCPSSFHCHSPYSTACVNDHCTCLSGPPPCKSHGECGELHCSTNHAPRCENGKCTCVDIGCTSDSACGGNITCSGGEHPTCHHDGNCLCRRDAGYCTTTSHCYYAHCERDYHHYCHSHECGCRHEPHGSNHCTRDSNCASLHCSHSKPICLSGKCQCWKTINTLTCHSRRDPHHHSEACPNTFCDSPYSETCLHGHCVCLTKGIVHTPACHSDTDCKNKDCTSNHIAVCYRGHCFCVVAPASTSPTTARTTTKKVTTSTSTTTKRSTTTKITTSTPTTTERLSTKKITSTPNTTERATTTKATTSTSTTKSPSTTTGTKPAIPCPVCDEALQCNWNRTCLPETQTCMIRSYVGYKFTVHCSMADDCQFIQSELDSGEIFCCNDRQCLSTYLGI